MEPSDTSEDLLLAMFNMVESGSHNERLVRRVEEYLDLAGLLDDPFEQEA